MSERQLPNPGDMPMVMCPKCEGWQPDADGFSVLACQFDDCDYCSHPSIDDDVCEVCGKKFTPTEGK